MLLLLLLLSRSCTALARDSSAVLPASGAQVVCRAKPSLQEPMAALSIAGLPATRSRPSGDITHC